MSPCAYLRHNNSFSSFPPKWGENNARFQKSRITHFGFVIPVDPPLNQLCFFCDTDPRFSGKLCLLHQQPHKTSSKCLQSSGIQSWNPEEEESHVSACKLRILRPVKVGQKQCWHVGPSVCRCYAEFRIPAAKCTHLSAVETCRRTEATQSNSCFHHFRSSFVEHVGARLTFASTQTNETPLSVGETLRSPW